MGRSRYSGEDLHDLVCYAVASPLPTHTLTARIFCLNRDIIIANEGLLNLGSVPLSYHTCYEKSPFTTNEGYCESIPTWPWIPNRQ